MSLCWRSIFFCSDSDLVGIKDVWTLPRFVCTNSLPKYDTNQPITGLPFLIFLLDVITWYDSLLSFPIQNCLRNYDFHFQLLSLSESFLKIGSEMLLEQRFLISALTPGFFWQNNATWLEVSCSYSWTSRERYFMLGLINLARNIVEVSNSFCYSYTWTCWGFNDRVKWIMKISFQENFKLHFTS